MGIYTIILITILGLVCIIFLFVSIFQLEEDEQIQKAAITAQEIFISSFILIVIVIFVDIIFS